MVRDNNKVLKNLKVMQNLATVTIMLKYLKKIPMEAKTGMAVDGMTVGQLLVPARPMESHQTRNLSRHPFSQASLAIPQLTNGHTIHGQDWNGRGK